MPSTPAIPDLTWPRGCRDRATPAGATRQRCGRVPPRSRVFPRRWAHLGAPCAGTPPLIPFLKLFIRCRGYQTLGCSLRLSAKGAASLASVGQSPPHILQIDTNSAVGAIHQRSRVRHNRLALLSGARNPTTIMAKTLRRTATITHTLSAPCLFSQISWDGSPGSSRTSSKASVNCIASSIAVITLIRAVYLSRQ